MTKEERIREAREKAKIFNHEDYSMSFGVTIFGEVVVDFGDGPVEAIEVRKALSRIIILEGIIAGHTTAGDDEPEGKGWVQIEG